MIKVGGSLLTHDKGRVGGSLLTQADICVTHVKAVVRVGSDMGGSKGLAAKQILHCLLSK